MPPASSVEAAPNPERRPSIRVESIAFNGQVMPVDDLGLNIPEAMQKKFIYQGQPRPVIVMGSVGSNLLSEGEPLVAQIAFADQLRELGLASEIAILGCCTLQWHNRLIKNFKKLAKCSAKHIKELWAVTDTKLIAGSLLQEIHGLLRELLKLHLEKDLPQRQQVFKILHEAYEKIMQVIEKLGLTEQNKSQLKRILSKEGFEAQLAEEAVKQALRVGNEWGKKTAKDIIKKYGDQSKTIPVVRWPAIYEIADPALRESMEYIEFAAQHEKTCSSHANILIQKIPFPTEESKQQYLREIKAFYAANRQCKEAFDNTVNHYLEGNNLNNSWEKGIGFSQEEIRQASLDFLFEECAWLAYIAKEHPEILILYPGSVSPAIEWTFKKFHPAQEVCWLPVITSLPSPQIQLIEVDTMKSQQKGTNPIAPAVKKTVDGSNNKVTISISQGAVSMQFEVPKEDLGGVMKEFKKTFGDSAEHRILQKNTEKISPQPTKSRTCTLL